jgi:hypothetical protein
VPIRRYISKYTQQGIVYGSPSQVLNQQGFTPSFAMIGTIQAIDIPISMVTNPIDIHGDHGRFFIRKYNRPGLQKQRVRGMIYRVHINLIRNIFIARRAARYKSGNDYDPEYYFIHAFIFST